MDFIEANGLFYKLSKESRTDFIKNEMYYKVLPGDYIQYSIDINDKVLIEKIIERAPKLTIGIIDTRLRLLRLPIESKIFKTHINYRLEAVFNISICVVLIHNNEITVIKEYGSIKERKHDLEICKDVYKSSVPIDFNKLYSNLNESINYTTPFYSTTGYRNNIHLNTFNIDPTHSLDFDDAISVDIENKRLYIHIVDININLLYTNLEENALSLGSTLYLPEGNLNILPNEFSENYFSLIEGKERRVITLEIELDDNGEGMEYLLYRDNIIIKHRYDYNTAQDALDNGEKHLVFLDKLLENPKWIFSKLNLPKRTISIHNGNISGIQLTTQNRVNKIVESLMIMTNRIVTTHLINIAPERYHEASTINNIPIVSISDPLLTLDILKKYKTANYSNTDTGHYALNIPHYTHFTSPIRRGFDILIHNILSGIMYGESELNAVIKHINSREVLNTKLVDFYERCKLLSFFSKHKIPYNFRVSRVTKAGILILAEKIMYTEFIHISKIIPNVRWTFIESNDDTISNKLVGVTTEGKRLLIEKSTSGTIIFNNINWLELCVDTFRITLG